MTLSLRHRIALIAFAGFLLTAVFHTEAAAQAKSSQGVRNIVIVHGAWADGSSWSKVIPLLQAKGLHVVAVQNPLTSLADDVAATKRAITLQDGPVLLVGHSYGGVVITEAGNDPKVVGLVYVAALAPSEGESRERSPGRYRRFSDGDPKGNRRRLRSGFVGHRKADVDGNPGSHSSSRFRRHNHDCRVEDQAILVRDCEQRPRCSSGA